MGFIGSAVGNVLGGLTGGIMGSGGLTNTFQGASPDIQKQDLIKQINALTPQQQQLSQMLTNQAQGNGPNPAQLMLNQATNKNNQQGAGMIASQKGISPALAARLIAQNTANTNQTAAGQGALMGAEQQLNAEGLLNTNLAQRQATLQQAQSAQNAAINTGSLGAQALTATAAGQNATTAGNIFGGVMQGIGSMLTPPSSGGGGGGGGGAGMASMAAMAMSKGGKVPHYSGGGIADLFTSIGNRLNPAGATDSTSPEATSASQGANKDGSVGMSENKNPNDYITSNPYPGSNPNWRQDLKLTPGAYRAIDTAAKGGEITNYGEVISPSPTPQPVVSDPDDLKNLRDIFIKHARGGSVHPYYKQGGKVPIIVSPGELIVHPDGKRTKVPGKAKVKGDSPRNDTVPTMTEGGSVVIPRTKVGSENKVAEFMAKVKETKEGRKEPGGFSRVLKAQKHLQSAHESLLAAHKAIKAAS